MTERVGKEGADIHYFYAEVGNVPGVAVGAEIVLLCGR